MADKAERVDLQMVSERDDIFRDLIDGVGAVEVFLCAVAPVGRANPGGGVGVEGPIERLESLFVAKPSVQRNDHSRAVAERIVAKHPSHPPSSSISRRLAFAVGTVGQMILSARPASAKAATAKSMSSAV